MSEAAKLNIGVQRNEDYTPHEFRLQDIDGQPIDLTGWSFVFRANSAPGLTSPPVIVITGTPNGNGSYIKLIDGDFGAFVLFIAKADIAALPGPISENVPNAFNLIGTDLSGYERIIARGLLIAEPGV